MRLPSPAGILRDVIRILLAACCLAPAPLAQQRAEWHTDFAAARALASEQHKPLFVVIRCER